MSRKPGADPVRREFRQHGWPGFILGSCLIAILGVRPGGAGAAPAGFVGQAAPGTSAYYHVLPGEHRKPAPLTAVRIAHQTESEPGAVGSGGVSSVYTLDLQRTNAAGETVTAIRLRLVPKPDGTRGPASGARWHRYQIRIPATDEAYDYRNVHTHRALLPPWDRFEDQFLPQPLPGVRDPHGWPETQRLLGQVLSLRHVEKVPVKTEPDSPVVLRLDPELLMGTGRTFRDREGHRLPQDQGENEYTYQPWTQADYAAMIDAGFNTFALIPGVEAWLRAQPVFYRRGLKGDAALDWPVDFYRSNYRGASMYADEPACVMLRDKEIADGLLHFSDAAAIIQSRAACEFERLSTGLGEALRRSGVSLGGLVLRQSDLAVWETRYETVFYQLAAGFAGFVHEGRYHLRHFYESPYSFDDYVRWSTGLERHHTAEEMLQIHFAMLRGAARHLDKDWGTSLYGQADPALAPSVFPLAYDMGARYLWFWTSGHAHHVPWPEQLALARGVRTHARARPRPSIRGPRPVVDRLILIPYGTFLVLESPLNRRHHWDLWWIRDLDRTGENEASQRYRRLMRAAFEEIHQALDCGESFDVAVDDGREPVGYRTVIHLAREP